MDLKEEPEEKPEEESNFAGGMFEVDVWIEEQIEKMDPEQERNKSRKRILALHAAEKKNWMCEAV